MKSIKCSKCGHEIAAVKPVHRHPAVVKRVIAAAGHRGSTIERLASIYAKYANVSYSSGRRAIQRMAKDGYLATFEPGYYYAR